uniref:hypothetical protein n=1 Tax=Vibrio jasicida TaxID=766224 RepID=UPI0005EE2A46
MYLISIVNIYNRYCSTNQTFTVKILLAVKNNNFYLGAYIVSPIAAKKLCSIIDNYLENKESFNYASDSFVTAVWNDAGINAYWSVTPLVWQGSKTARFSRYLSGRRENVFVFFYEKTLFNLMPYINKVRAF